MAVGGTRGFFQGSLETCSCLTESRVEGVAGKGGVSGAPHPPGPFFPMSRGCYSFCYKVVLFPEGASHPTDWLFFFVFSFFGKKIHITLKLTIVTILKCKVRSLSFACENPVIPAPFVF